MTVTDRGRGMYLTLQCAMSSFRRNVMEKNETAFSRRDILKTGVLAGAGASH